MGRSFVSYQLNIARYTKESAIEKLVSLYGNEGFRICPDDSDAHFALYVLYKPNSPWLAICELDVESLPIMELKKSTLRFARHFKSLAIGSMVYNSDVLIMDLECMNPHQSDLIVIDPEQGYQDELGYNPKATAGKAKSWVGAMGCNEQELKSLWEMERSFADDQLIEIGGLFGFGETADFFVIEKFLEYSRPEGYELIKLPFTSIKQLLPPFEIVTVGSPRFEPQKKRISDLSCNREVFLTFSNQGGPRTGVLLSFELPKAVGDNIHYSDIAIARKRICTPDYDPNDMIIHQASVERHLSQDSKMWVVTASFPDFPIPEGVRVHYENASNWKRISDAQFLRWITIRFTWSGNTNVSEFVRISLNPI